MTSHRTALKNHLAPTSFNPLNFPVSRAKGIFLYDDEGRRYYDMISGISVNNLGHQHPEIIQAAQKQLRKHTHVMVFGEYIQESQAYLAEQLNDITPEHINSFYLVNSGSEAIEGALKLARKVTSRPGIVSMRNAYHGSTTGALSLMDNEYYSLPYSPLLPQVRFAEFNNIDTLDLIDENTSCVVSEVVQGEAGYLPAKPDFLRALRKKCDETGTLWIADEIQSGFGRTGKFWAFEHYDVTPDVIVMAKGMGGGLPIGCFAAGSEYMNHLAAKPILGHITTFGGNPVSCAASSAVLDVLKRDNIIDQIDRKSDIFLERLKHKRIKGIIGKGFMLSLQLESFEVVENVMRNCYRRGLLIDWFLYDLTSLRLAPPLIMNTKQIHKVCDIILAALYDLD